MRSITFGVLLLCTGSVALGQETAVTVSMGDVPALVLTVPQGAKVTPLKNKTVIQTADMFLHIWPVAGVKTPAEALPRLAELIKGDVLKFNASATNTLAVAGAPALHLIGSAVEADDGDAATADVVIFAVGPRVFAACVHGEANDASKERAPMLRVLKTAKMP